jgi:DNA invertase Pin-like site-specific DNA recombinase
VKLTFFNVLKIAIAVGAGYEFGRTLPRAIALILNEDGREQIKTKYREGVKEAEKNGKAVRLVKDTETPTGD